ncbi:hypothetical protein [Nocardioides sambongensis]|uniref:hypothetical protein n=1 Tax=Nocardioides sambongensis TaxID=2589074 RepID=UPI001127270A|nr:hypothetical protein [Nocardioides sambongensis]
MSPNLYDLLDVDESASTDEVRAAWKVAVADLDPTDRRFRAYNDAAGVLLDADRRATYDAELARERALEDDEAEPDAVPPVAEEAEPASEDEVVLEDRPEDERPEATEGPTTDAVASSATGEPPRWAWALMTVLAVLSVVALAVVLMLPGVTDEGSPSDAADAEALIEDEGTSAQVTAREQIVPVLGYDYRTMDEDLTAIQAQMTEEMAATQAESWPSLTKEAEAQRIVVTAEAPYVGLTRLSEDGDTATVVTFIDQRVQKRGAEPFTLRMWATLTMVSDGGDWLLDDICTEGDCS